MSRQSRRNFLTHAGLAAGSGLLAGPVPALAGQTQGGDGRMPFQRSIPVQRGYDLVVCGGGPAGCAAALAARREGLSVLLVEGQGQLGGMATSGLVSHWLGGRTQSGQWVVGGLFREMALEAAERGCAVLPRLDPAEKYHPYGWYNWFIHGVPIDPCGIARYLDEKLNRAGADVLLFTQAVDVVVEGDRITHVVTFNKSGLAAVPARAVIDATGDADMAARSGCQCVVGRQEDHLTTPATLEFHLSHVNRQRLTGYIQEQRDPKLRAKIRQLREQGIWRFPYDIFICTQLTEPDTFYVNTIRLVGVDGTDGRSVSDAMVRGRQEVDELLQILRRHVPGFEEARLKCVAPLLGVRESRRIVTDSTMTVADLSEGKQFPDTIGFSMYGWDLPDVKQPSVQPLASDTVEGYKYKIKKGPTTPLPYGVMIPRPIRNLACPGRAVGVERQVLGPVRVMAPCMAMGEAAGAAARQVVASGVSFSQVDVESLRDRLRQAGAIVDSSRLPEVEPRVDQV
ncbi:MAG: FAD-dependent oxidoreductase [Thermoguttaceae bacterium]